METINWTSRSRTLCWIFWKKFIKKKNKARQTRKIIGVAIRSHVILFRFLPISEHCNWGKNLSQLSQKVRFLEPSKKILISLITGEPVSATISIALFWWSRRFIYFFLFILLQFYDWLCEANLPRLREQ